MADKKSSPSPDVLKSESVTNFMSGHETEMGAATPESLGLDPVLLLVKVDISSVQGIECVSQNSALAIKGLSVPVCPVINELPSRCQTLSVLISPDGTR